MEDEQLDPTNSSTPSRVLRDIMRKKQVILVIVGQASVTITHSKITLSDPRDLLRIAVELEKDGLAVVQASSEMLVPLHSLSELVHARIYAVTDLPDLEVHPTDQLLLNRYEAVSYHDLGMVFDHIKEMNANTADIEELDFT